ITMSVEAAKAAFAKWNSRGITHIRPLRVGAVYVGSESHPYAVKPTATFVAETLGCTPSMTAADMEFACKAGTAAIQCCLGLASSGIIDLGLAIGADTSQGAPADALEYSASAGAAAFVIGTSDIIARINATFSFTTETPDFWRREGGTYPLHGGRFTGEPAYFKHIISCGRALMEKMGKKPSDYKYAVFHQPNGRFPLTAGKELGFKEEQLKAGLLCPEIGNTYSAASLLGLCAVLDVAEPGDRILLVSFGSGAGSDGFDITVTDAIKDSRFNRTATRTVRQMIENYKLLSYGLYAKYRGKIRMGGE
ncbi:MAG: hydroxymethylglutaryl-CoA synthase, partial [Thermoplasmata archaeon]